MEVAGYFSALAAESSAIAAEHWRDIVLWAAFWFGAHGVLQYVVPALVPGVYDFLGRKRAAEGKPMSPSRIARDGRTKVLCFFMGLYVAAASLRGILDGEFVQLRDDAFSSSPLTRHLCALAAGFFAWDIVVCIIDRENWMYQGHAWTCFLTFFWCLRPFSQSMTMIVLLFEASTPFLHARLSMIQGQMTEGKWAPLFNVIQASFVLSFFASRIAMGYPMTLQWAAGVYHLAATGKAHCPEVIYTLLAFALFLSGLNGYWFLLMVKSALGLGRPEDDKTDTSAREVRKMEKTTTTATGGDASAAAAAAAKKAA